MTDYILVIKIPVKLEDNTKAVDAAYEIGQQLVRANAAQFSGPVTTGVEMPRKPRLQEPKP